MNANTAWTDLTIALSYTLGPLIWYLTHADRIRKPTPEQARSRNT